jgi:hypothetical protein
MRFAVLTASLIVLGTAPVFITGCSTDQPGATVTPVQGDYSTNVSAAPDKVTTAAQKACADLKLNNINGNGTKVDGQVTAQTADGKDVTISIAQAGEDVSKVTIHVGTTGDEAISKQLVDRFNSHLSWF